MTTKTLDTTVSKLLQDNSSVECVDAQKNHKAVDALSHSAYIGAHTTYQANNGLRSVGIRETNRNCHRSKR